MQNILLPTCLLFSILLNAQNVSELLSKSKEGYKISGEIKNMEDTTVILAYYFGGKQYATDTTDVVNGKLTFSGDKALGGGIYLLVLPGGKYFELIISEQKFSLICCNCSFSSLNSPRSSRLFMSLDVFAESQELRSKTNLSKLLAT